MLEVFRVDHHVFISQRKEHRRIVLTIYLFPDFTRASVLFCQFIGSELVAAVYSLYPIL